jgi:hypothetical protein
MHQAAMFGLADVPVIHLAPLDLAWARLSSRAASRGL